MNILILGNGFDLAHYLPTQYSDFLDFINAFMEPDCSYYSQYIENMKTDKPKVYAEIEDDIKENVLLDYFLSIYKERCNEGKNGWIDFESEISIIIQNLDAAKKDIESKMIDIEHEAELNYGLSIRLLHFISKKQGNDRIFDNTFYTPLYFDKKANSILEDLNRLTRLLEIYLYEYVEKQDCNYRIIDLQNKGIDHVLSFNYTDTYKKLYDPAQKAKYCYVHGKVKDGDCDTCNLVLGIDEFLPHDRVDTDNQFVWFKKFYQRIYKQTGSEYIDWINDFEDLNQRTKLNKPVMAYVYIYGHSLDITDKDVLSRIILMDNTITSIYYHNRESMAKQISNLVKLIGEENLIKMTGGTDRKIVFVQSESAEKVG